MERLTLLHAPNILSPSYHERRQLIEFYSIAKERIHVIPRGIDMQLLDPKVRFLNGPPKFCSLGSIKPQKNILGLIRLFAVIQTNYPGATLRIIGAIQNFEYYATVLAEIQCLGLNEMVEMTGYIPPNNIALAIEEAHLHLSASNCETFGRSIFETLASGLPNIARLTDNAAAEFLAHLPYARFVDDDIMALTMLDEMLSKLSALSAMALEIGCLYDDEILARLLVAKICKLYGYQ
jgi:glycosyltransferase involved in cell wall biosynthesis